MDAQRRVDLSRFIEELEGFSGDVARTVTEVARKEAFDIARELVLATPVGNPELWAAGPESAPEGYVGGHARRNWQVTANAPAESELPGVDESGEQSIGAAEQSLAQLEPFPLIFITNNAPYIERLNEGHSTQVVAGYIDSIVDRHAEQFRFDEAPEQGGPE